MQEENAFKKSQVAGKKKSFRNCSKTMLEKAKYHRK